MNSLFTKLKLKDSVKVLIIYATTSGNAEIVAEALADGLKQIDIETNLERSELADPLDIYNYNLTILVSSTWNVGQLNDHIIKFHEILKKLNFKNRFIQVVGLGDSKHYDIFCGAADILSKTVKDIEAIQLKESLRIDGSPYPLLKDIKQWGKELGKELLINL